MENFKYLFEGKSEKVKHKGYTITHIVSSDDGSEYFFVSKGREHIGSIDLSIGANGIKEDIRELTRSSDSNIDDDEKLQALISKYAK